MSLSKSEDEGSSPYMRAKIKNYEKTIRYALGKLIAYDKQRKKSKTNEINLQLLFHLPEKKW